MEKDAKIYVAGHRGMAGQAICRELYNRGYTNIIGRTSRELDLRNQSAVQHFFKKKNRNASSWRPRRSGELWQIFKPRQNSFTTI